MARDLFHRGILSTRVPSAALHVSLVTSAALHVSLVTNGALHVSRVTSAALHLLVTTRHYIDTCHLSRHVRCVTCPVSPLALSVISPLLSAVSPPPPPPHCALPGATLGPAPVGHNTEHQGLCIYHVSIQAGYAHFWPPFCAIFLAKVCHFIQIRRSPLIN